MNMYTEWLHINKIRRSSNATLLHCLENVIFRDLHSINGLHARLRS